MRLKDSWRRIPKPARVLLWALAGVVALYAAVALALTALLPPARLAAWATPRLEAAIGPPVEVGGVRLRVFPRIAVRVDRLTISNPPGFSERPMLRLDALDLRPRLLPLLARRIVVDEIRFHRPRLLVEKGATGAFNLAGLSPERPEGAAPEAEAPARDGPAGFAVRRLAVTDGIVLYDDRGTGKAIRVGDLDAELALAAELSETRRFDAEIRASFGDLTARTAGSDSAFPLPALALEADASVQLEPDSADLRHVRLALGEVVVEGSGRATQFRSPERRLSVALEATGIDAGRLWATLPATRDRDLRGSGVFDLELAVEGRAGGGEWPDVRGRLAFRDVGASTPEVSDLLSGLTGSVRLDGDTARADEIRGRLFGRPTTLSFTVHDPLDPALDARWQGELPLEELAKLAPKPERAMSGRVAAQLHVAGKPSDPGSLRLSGPITLRDVTVRGPAPAVPVHVADATLRFTGRGLRAERVSLTLGRSDLTLGLDAQNVVPLLLVGPAKAPAPATIGFTARSRRLDWTELFPEKDAREVGYTRLLWARMAQRPVGGRPVEEVAREQRFALTAAPPLEAEGTVAIDTFIQRNLRATDVALRVTLRDGVLRLHDLWASLHDGRVAGEWTADLRGGPPYPTQWSFAAESVQAAAFLDRFTLLGDAIGGTLSFRLGGRGQLDAYLLPVPGSVNADARGVLVNGAIQDWGPTNALASFLRNDGLRQVRVGRWVGTFEIVGSQVRFRDWSLAGESLAATLAGSFGFDGRMNAALRLQIDSSLARRLGGPAATALVAEGGSSWLALRMTGPAKGPTLALDTDAMRQIAEGAVRRQLAEETKEVRQEVEKKIQQELGGALRRLFGGRDTTRADTARRDTAPEP